MQNHPKIAIFAFYTYLTVLLGFNSFLAIDIFLDKGIACDHKNDWQIFTLLIIDTLQTTMLIIVASIMYRQSKT